jgi:hypothetical protein
VLLDEVRLKDQRLDLRVGDDEFEVNDPPDQLARLAVVPAPGLKIGPDAVLQILRLAYVDDLPCLVLVQVASTCTRTRPGRSSTSADFSVSLRESKASLPAPVFSLSRVVFAHSLAHRAARRETL